jgi:hypothetical protein
LKKKEQDCYLRTGVNICDYHFCALIGKEAGGFGANALACAGDDGGLVGEEAFWVIEVADDL